MNAKLNTAEALLSQAYELNVTDIDRARQLAEEAHELIHKDRSDAKIVLLRANIIIAEWHRQRGNYTEAVDGFLNAIEGYEAYEQDEWLIFALYRLGMTYTLIGYHTDAITLHVRQYEIAEALKNHKAMGNAMRRIGLAHYSLQQDERAIQDYRKSLEHFERSDDAAGIGGVYNNLALLYQRQRRIELALDYARKSLALFEQADYMRGQTLAQGTLTGILVDGGDIEEARVHAERNLELAKELQLQHTLMNAYLNMGKLLTHSDQPEEALASYERALALAERHQDLYIKILGHEHLCNYYEHIGDYKQALEHQRIHHALEIQSFNDAAAARFEVQAIRHKAQQAQTDLIQQKRLHEEERNRYERLTQMKDELISTASHDLKNPLASIQVMTHLLSRLLPEADERVMNVIQRIDDSVDRMRNLIINLLDLERLQTGKTLEVRAVSMGDYLQEIVNEFALIAEQKGLNIRYHKPDPHLSVLVDPEQMQQVLQNLLSNACKYTNKGGSIDVSVLQVNEQLIMQVRDTGLGIPEQDIKHIFERFYRVKDESHLAQEGTGLGLAICKSIVERHDGQIEVKSKVGKGTSFTVILPYVAQQV